MSSLHDELSGGTKIIGCKVCGYLADLAPSERAEWQAELNMPTAVIGNMAVVRALQKREVPVTEASIRRHRENHARVR